MRKDGDLYSPEILQKRRKKGVDELSEMGYHSNITFGCDDCDIASRCTYAFDIWNVDGDCLAMK